MMTRRQMPFSSGDAAPAADGPTARPDSSSDASQTGSASPAPSKPSSADKRAAHGDCGPLLRKRFPALFGGGPKPLKLRIQVDIQERAPGVFSKQALSAFFRRYTGSTAYLQAVAQGAHRLDLDGQPAGEISEEHRRGAVDELARRPRPSRGAPCARGSATQPRRGAPRPRSPAAPQSGRPVARLRTDRR
jgi:hypothetical protein